jgi:hypothetical protein
MSPLNLLLSNRIKAVKIFHFIEGRDNKMLEKGLIGQEGSQYLQE